MNTSLHSDIWSDLFPGRTLTGAHTTILRSHECSGHMVTIHGQVFNLYGSPVMSSFSNWKNSICRKEPDLLQNPGSLKWVPSCCLHPYLPPALCTSLDLPGHQIWVSVRSDCMKPAPAAESLYSGPPSKWKSYELFGKRTEAAHTSETQGWGATQIQKSHQISTIPDQQQLHLKGLRLSSIWPLEFLSFSLSNFSFPLSPQGGGCFLKLLPSGSLSFLFYSFGEQVHNFHFVI